VLFLHCDYMNFRQLLSEEGLSSHGAHTSSRTLLLSRMVSLEKTLLLQGSIKQNTFLVFSFFFFFFFAGAMG